MPHGGVFRLATDPKEIPSSAAGVPPGDEEDGGRGPFDEELDMGLEADNEVDGDKEPTEDTGVESQIDPGEIELLREIIKAPTGSQPSTAPKSGNKRGSTHLNGSSGSSSEDLDASRGARARKKGETPTKASHPSQWSDEDIDIVHQIRYRSPALSKLSLQQDCSSRHSLHKH